jgi:radical SAM protein with 4Fe4S-binding SPASM domain
VQEPPFNVSFELTLGCNLRCPMCAVGVVHDKPGRDYKFMELRTITRVVEQIRDLKWNCRIGFAMRGEPSLHPQRAEMMAEVRKYLPKAHITMLTNGGGLLGGPGPVANVNALFDAGLNVLGMDHYTNIKFVPKILEAFCEEHKPKRNKKPLPELISGDHYGQFQFFRYPQDRRGNPHVRRPRNSRTLIQIRDIMEQDKDNKTGTHSKVFNYAGLSFPPDDSMAGKRCHHPFRQLVVQWDGNVPGCCNDWASTYNVANVHERTLDQIWQSSEFGAMREKLYHGQRDFKPCLGCNHRSYRVGLLPDLTGKGKLRKPDEVTAKEIARVVRKGNHTPIVNPQPWMAGGK